MFWSIDSDRKSSQPAGDLAVNDGSAKANIIPVPSEVVWGIACLCDPAAMRKMDANEGLNGGHYRHLTVELAGPEFEI
jgi:hypothetical protein